MKKLLVSLIVLGGLTSANLQAYETENNEQTSQNQNDERIFGSLIKAGAKAIGKAIAKGGAKEVVKDAVIVSGAAAAAKGSCDYETEETKPDGSSKKESIHVGSK